ncbi:RNA-binding domain-containing protein [Venturia nashicola]|uniref:RNA-binding domain-containing protein n=1 Tax=Venturia nashicola TaxID=86259 RepID=A0A4Z1PF72_9PEZI|nr:RNA-binding domain-containing protein [Venturia nashicola]TLD39383.1 RNA-binding domain-containing protein [Venturia nashicola]
MAPRRKRQKLSEEGGEQVTSIAEDSTLSHSKNDAAASKDAKEHKRQLFVRQLPRQTTTEDLTQHFSQSLPVKHAVVVTDAATKECKGYGFVSFADAEDAQRALEEFHGSLMHGSKIRVELAEARQRTDDGTPGQKPASAAKERREAAAGEQQAPKLIVRNLPWTIDTPEKITLLFRSYGKIKHCVVPKNAKGTMMGFAIVVMRGRKNAEKALEGINGKTVEGRTLAVDWAVDKDTWQSGQKDEVVKEEAERLGKEATREDNGTKVDDEDGHVYPSGDNTRASDGEDDDEQEVEDLTAEDDNNEEEEDQTMKLRTTTNESTLFIRNLPFTCTDEGLKEHFEDFGAVRYARIVLDHGTERPRGTGFVCFYKVEDADGCLQEAPRAAIRAPPGKGKKDMADNFGHTVLQNELGDPSGRFTLNGRVLIVTRAVEKGEASRLTAEGVAHRNVRDKDKRRLYLLNEGTIASNTPLYEKLSPSEIAMREASAKQRKALIESNPSLHISLVRLSVRNIPRTITSKDLKALAREAVVGFATDVKEGRRERLSKEELARGGDEMKEAERLRKAKGKGIVTQATIVFEGREGTKVQEGAGRSRGYGFIEYATHRSALMGLRWLNGHSLGYQAAETEKKGKKPSKEDLQERKKRLIVEFAIENAQVVTRRNELQLKSRERPKAPADGGEDTGKTTKAAGSKIKGSVDSRKRKAGENGAVADKLENPTAAEKLANRSRIIARKRNSRRESRKK